MTLKSFTKAILFSIIICGFWSCAPLHKDYLGKAYRNLTAYYNTYFNAKEIYNQDLRKIELANPDHYDRLLAFYKLGDEASATGLTSDMDLVIKKMSNLITYHAKSDWVDNAYILMGKAYYLKGDYFSALDNFAYVYNTFPNDTLKETALIWTARSYIKMKKDQDAQSSLDLALSAKPKSIKKNNDELFSTAAFFALNHQDTSSCINYLKRGIKGSRLKFSKIRFHFIIAQLEIFQNKPELAKIHYDSILRLNPNYEIGFGAKMGLANLLGNENPTAERQLMNRYLKDDKNIEFHDQILYTLGKISLKEGNLKQAIRDFNLSLSSSLGDGNQKGLNYEQLAFIYLNKKKNFKQGSAYFDSTVTFLDKDYPNYQALVRQKQKLSELVENYKIIDQGDTLITFSTLNMIQRRMRVHNLILAQIQKQKEEELRTVMAYQKQLALANSQFAGTQINPNRPSNQNSFFNTSSGVPGGGASQNFYNPSSGNQGQYYAQGANTNNVSGGFGGALSSSGSSLNSGGLSGGGIGVNNLGGQNSGSFFSFSSGGGGNNFNNSGSGNSFNSSSGLGINSGSGSSSPFSNFANNNTGINNSTNGPSGGTNFGNQGTGSQGIPGGSNFNPGNLPGSTSVNTSGSLTGSLPGFLPGNGSTNSNQNLPGNLDNSGNGNSFSNSSSSNFGQNNLGGGGIGNGINNGNSNFGSYYGGGGSGSFYFNNPIAMSSGYAQFLQKWGNRTLKDNWRIGSKNGSLISDNTQDSVQSSKSATAVLKTAGSNPKKAEEKYLSLIPKTQDQIDSIQNKMILANLANGEIFDQDLKNLPKAIDSYLDALKLNPDSTHKVQTYYNLYSLYSRLTDPLVNSQSYQDFKTDGAPVENFVSVEQAKIKRNEYREKILQEFPNSNFATYFLHPELLYADIKPDTILEGYYDSTYVHFLKHDFRQVLKDMNSIPIGVRGNYMAPKFAYLKALTIGYTHTLPDFLIELRKIEQSFPKDSIGMEARRLIKEIHEHESEYTRRPTALEFSQDENGFELAQRILNQKEAYIKFKRDSAERVRKSYYKLDYDPPFQFIILLKNLKINQNTLRLNLSLFEQYNFSALHLKNQVSTLIGKIPAVFITTFPNIKTAISYYQKFEEQKTDLIGLPANQFEYYFISSANYQKLKDTSSLNIYREYFNEFMLPHTSTINPKPLPVPTQETKAQVKEEVKSINLVPTPFSFVKTGKFLVTAIIKNPRINLNSIRLKLSLYNQANYGDKNYRLATDFVDNQFLSLSIGYFESLESARRYYIKLIKNKEDIFPVTLGEVDIFIVNPENLQKIKSRDIESDYLSFFDKNLKNP